MDISPPKFTLGTKMIFDLFPWWKWLEPQKWWFPKAGIYYSRVILLDSILNWEFFAQKQGIEKILAGANHTQAISKLLVI